MKKEKQNRKTSPQDFFPLGIIFIAVGVVFMITINRGLGIAFIAFGIIWMMINRKNNQKGGKTKDAETKGKSKRKESNK